MDVALREAHNISFREWRSRRISQEQEAIAAQRDPHLLRSRVDMRRVSCARRDADPRDGYAPRLRILREQQLLGRHATVGERLDVGSANDLHALLPKLPAIASLAPVIVKGEMVAKYHKYCGSATLMLTNATHDKLAKKCF
ncbi:MAG TPA: hypothetical protein VGH59_05005 [Casimicrobiaceae bacterium]